MKFKGILTPDKIDIIIKNAGIPSLDDRQQIDFIETVANIVYRYDKHFGKLTNEELARHVQSIAFVFETLCDVEINPYAAKLMKLALRAFNNNVFGALEACL